MFCKYAVYAGIVYFVVATLVKYAKIPENLENTYVEENKHEIRNRSRNTSLFYILR